jgi:hypothetical protein
MLLANILDTKVINNQAKCEWSGVMCEQAQSVCAGMAGIPMIPDVFGGVDWQ